MPGPGRGKSKSKSKKSKGSTSTGASAAIYDNDAFLEDIDNAEGWGVVVDVLCSICELPDLTTRSGLKKVHSNFNAIYNKIDAVYQRNVENDRIRAGVVGIYAKMCADSLLRDKLFAKGILDKIIPLLDIDDTRHLALRALNTITHHGGAVIRAEIAKHAPTLTQLLRQFPDDEKVCDLSVSVLSHSVGAAFEGDPRPRFPALVRDLDLAEILKVVLETTKRPFRRRRSIIDHAVSLVATTTLHGTSAFKKYPHAIKFLVAGLRSKDWVTRSTCLVGLIVLQRKEQEDDQKTLDPQIFMAACQRGVPNHLSDVLADYGPTKSEIFLTLKSTRDFTNAIMQSAQDHNMYALGMKLAPLVLITEFSVTEGRFEVEDPRTGRRTFDNCGLPFELWGDALKHCAKAIREKGNPREVDWADILEIKWCIMRRKLREAAELAKRGIERNPEQAYFYYALTLMADNVQGLKSAKKGLKCKQITPFTKYQMMQRAVEQAGDMGLTMLQEMPEVGNPKWDVGIAFLMSALEDSKSYIEGAPPDNRHMKNISYWYIVLTVLTKEDLSPDLRELQDALRKLSIADQFSRFMGIEPPKTFMRLTQQLVVQHYTSAIKEFSSVYAELDRCKEAGAQVVNPEKLEDDLEAWLNDMKLDDGTQEHDHDHEHGHGDCSSRPAQTDLSHVRLYRCSWCGNPSAALRKCNGCSKARYCDHSCQKQHWSEHKKACKAESTSTANVVPA